MTNHYNRRGMLKSQQQKSVEWGDFEEPPVPTNFIRLSIEGPEKQGKTTTALSAPGPIAYIDLDFRGNRAIEAARSEGKVIKYLPIATPRNVGDLDAKTAAAQFRDIWNSKFVKNFKLACELATQGLIRTTIIDTVTDLWELELLSIFGRTDKVQPRDRSVPNNEFSNIIRHARKYPMNLILISKVKEEWVNDKPTGRLKRAGYSYLGSDVDNMVHVSFTPETGAVIKVLLSGDNGSLNGQVYTQEDWGPVGPFAYFAMQAIPGSTLEDWT